MRVVFFGTADFAVPALERIIAGKYEVVGCITVPDKPKGRGRLLSPSPVKEAAGRVGISVRQPDSLSLKALEGWQADVGVVVAYGRILPGELLRYPPRGVIGLHPSLLPKYRGAAPIVWAILKGDTETGITVFRLDGRLDAGDILLQRRVSIEPGEDAESLTGRLAYIGAEELLRSLKVMQSGRAVFHPQEDSMASYAPKLTKAQGIIDWESDAGEIERLVRACVPWPCATTYFRGNPLKIWRAHAVAGRQSGDYVAGSVVAVKEEHVCVATGNNGAVAISQLQSAGGRRMSARDFLAGHRVRVGDVFGRKEVQT